MDRVKVEMVCCQEAILEELANNETQREIAKTYWFAIRSSWPTDWKVVNAAIVAKFGSNGLERIKEMAWSGKCFDDPEMWSKEPC